MQPYGEVKFRNLASTPRIFIQLDSLIICVAHTNVLFSTLTCLFERDLLFANSRFYIIKLLDRLNIKLKMEALTLAFE